MPGFVGEQAPVMVDHHMATTVPGLFAVGDVSYSGSAWTEAVPSPPGRIRGSGLMNAVRSACRGAAAAVEYLSGERPGASADASLAAELKEGIYRPVGREKGISALEVVRRVQQAVTPVRYSNWKR
ncbi:MAG: hypothetical protein ACUVT4_06755 [Actinomycetota bacterium]